MDKPSIVNKFLQEGFLLSPAVLEKITGQNMESALSYAKTKNLLVLTGLEEPELTVSIKQPEKKKMITIKDIVESQNKKYNTIKNILSTKLNPVSINKLSQSQGPQTIIGMVSEKTAKGFMAEDPTGKIEVFCDKPLPQNSVLGFTGTLHEGAFLTSTISYPDIPLGKKIKNMDFSIVFKKEKEQPKILVDNKKEISDFETPSVITIKKSEPINVLVYKPETAFNKNQATEALKTRLLPEPKIPSESHIISEEPDIFWIIQKDPWEENYKGVRIVSGESAELKI